VGVGAAQNFAVEHAGKTDIRAVERTPRHFVHAVMADRAGAEHRVAVAFTFVGCWYVWLFGSGHQFSSTVYAASAASKTARTILS
jgi:hypothetical protein